MQVFIEWNQEAVQAWEALTPGEQMSVADTMQSLTLSPSAGTFYQRKTAYSREYTVWVAYGFQARVAYTLARQSKGMIIRIEGVAPTDLPPTPDT